MVDIFRPHSHEVLRPAPGRPGLLFIQVLGPATAWTVNITTPSVSCGSRVRGHSCRLTTLRTAYSQEVSRMFPLVLETPDYEAVCKGAQEVGTEYFLWAVSRYSASVIGGSVTGGAVGVGGDGKTVEDSEEPLPLLLWSLVLKTPQERQTVSHPCWAGQFQPFCGDHRIADYIQLRL
ncbi:myomegalin-like isoform X1 [Lates japonicus]|uniref:Myomegalin-like isoform X1 n=1 Tax=Lates japonicus TaxID=270547 RepID=A0AAD3MNY5_LATJO|nr:myomegalin-like isoform X1 [Lates japonicus]